MKILKTVALIMLISLLTAFFSEVGMPLKPNEPSGIYVISANKQNDYSAFAAGEAVINNIGVSAKSALLCTGNGILLYEKQADVPVPMASITKVMTAVVVLENVGDLTENVKVPSGAVGVEGSSVYLKAGETISYGSLLYALMLESANDAAVCLAESVSGSVSRFVGLMNEKAKDLSMDMTSFKNPHGLYEDGHYTTARDYAKLMSYALKNDTFRKIISTKKFVEQNDEKTLTRVMTNHNRLLNTYKNMIGGKTGFTKASGRTLVTAAEKDGTTLICITLNAPDDWNDHVSLFEAGFDLIETKFISENELSVSIPVGGGSEETVKCSPDTTVSVTCLKGKEVEVEFFIPKFLFAPVEKGDTVGYAVIFAGGEEYERVPIKAGNSVTVRDDGKEYGFFEKIKSFLKL